jgi:hypothetical protein
MTQQLPAHLQGRQVRNLTERASEGMGGSLPPHISIRGNAFTFVDAAGTEYQPTLVFRGTVVDVSDNLNKRYYVKPFDQQAEGEPPTCWSANGIAPSREAAQPQSATCAGCPHNERGSKISALSGASIKACRDEKWLAILIPEFPGVLWQLVLTPGSFKTWKSYTETMRQYGKELSLGITQFSFVPKTNGMLMFEDAGWIDAATADVVEAVTRDKLADAIVGRTDVPRAMITAPAPQAQLIAPQPVQEVLPPQGAPTQLFPQLAPAAAPQQAFVPVAAPSQAPTAPRAPFPVAQPSTAPVMQPQMPGVVTTAPANESTQRRRRRTQAEIAADNAAQGQSSPVMPAAQPQVNTLAQVGIPPQAPFPVAQQPVQAAPAPNTFGISEGAPVNPEMVAMLEKMGFKRT